MRLRNLSLLVAVISTVFLFVGFYGEDGFHLDRGEPNIVIRYIAYCAIRMVVVWTSILTCLGFAARYLQKFSPVLGYLNEAVYPLFILHLTVITILGYFVVGWQVALWLKYLFVTSTTLVGILAAYHFLIRPFNVMRLLFGVKPKGGARSLPVADQPRAAI